MLELRSTKSYLNRELNPRLNIEVTDKELGFLGWVVIDRFLSECAIGGVRMRDGLTIDEVANLARELTLKFAFLNIPVGGAKAAVIWKPFSSDEERNRIFTAFGKNLGPLLTKRIYIAGEDMGTSSIDIYHMKKGAGINIERPRSNHGTSGYYTALTVFISAEKLANNLGFKLKGTRVAIDGFGKVGTWVAKLLADTGAKIVGVSTIKGGIYNPRGIDIDRLMELKKESGDDAVNLYTDAEHIEKDRLLALDTDIFVPCAGPYTITKENIPQLKAKMVVSGANISATTEAESLMFERGIHYIPGFVSSSGGILYYAIAEHGFGRSDIERIMKNGFGKQVSRLVKHSKEENVSLSQKAREIAERNLKRLELLTVSKQKKQVAKHGLREFLSIALWKCYKQSLKFRASRLLRPFALKYIEETLSDEASQWMDL